jgi:hypothetical protein
LPSLELSAKLSHALWMFGGEVAEFAGIIVAVEFD